MVEEEVSLWATDIFTNGVASACAELGIIVVAHTPLGAGFLTGQIKRIEDFGENDHHSTYPRFQGENFAKNIELVKQIEDMAKKKRCTPAQLALSWLKVQGKRAGMPFIAPVAGARSVERVVENCKDIGLDEVDLEAIQEILATFPVVGGRYPAFLAGLAEY